MQKPTKFTSALLSAPPPVPGESDLDACKRIFGGKVFPCNRCGAEIFWPGVCDDCDAVLRARDTPPTVGELMAAANVPSALRHCTWENFDETNFPVRVKTALGVARAWRPSRGPSIITLLGPPGAGKTHCAVAILCEYLKSGRRRCRFAAVPDLLSSLRSSYHSGIEEDLVSQLESAGLLVLDDLGASRGTDWAVDVQSTIVSSRYNSERGTVFTSNLSMDEIAGRIDKRIASRLSEGLVIHVEASDYRARQAS